MFELDPSAPNIFPAKYRQVAMAEVDVELTSQALSKHFVGKEAYMRTRFIVVRSGDHTALVEVAKAQDGQPLESEELFSEITDLRMLATAAECAYLRLPDTDVGVPAHMATAVGGAGYSRCVIVEGRYSHVSFLLNPDVLRVNVLDIVPPAPSKLLDQLQRVLDIAEDLPPILVTSESVDSLDLLEAERAADPSPNTETAVLLPCQGPGVTIDGAAVEYLDQRPEKDDWTLLGCARSDQIHRWFYGSSATRVDTCPRRFLGTERDRSGATFTRCCLLQSDMEQVGRTTLVPWGSSLQEVRAAIEALIEAEGFSWTPT